MLHIIKIGGVCNSNELFKNSNLTIKDVFEEIEKNDFYTVYFKNNKAHCSYDECGVFLDFSAEYVMFIGDRYKPHIKQFLYIINGDVNTSDVQYYLHEEE